MPASAPKIRTVGYLPTYRGALESWAARLDFSKVSYVNIAFADISPTGDVSLPDPTLHAFVEAAHAAGVKVCIAVGGADTVQKPEVVQMYAHLLSEEQRGDFVRKLSLYLGDNDLDCLDLDLEGESVKARQYEAFVAALRAELSANGKQLTAALARWFANRIPRSTLDCFDFINVMAYDLCRFWEGAPCEHSSIAAMTDELAWWLDRGVPNNKLVVGMPFYGYRWSGGHGEAMTYADILSNYRDRAHEDRIETGDGAIFFNSKRTIIHKARTAARSYGGIMIWELGQDAPGSDSLLKAIHSAL
jgi:GH18 family chitinase